MNTFNFLPDFSSPITCKYLFNTNIHSTERGKEYRVGLSTIPYRKLIFQCLEQKDEQERLFNFFVKNIKIPVYVPIFSERLQFIGVSDLTQVIDSSIQVDYSNLFNVKDTLRTCTMIGIDTANNNTVYEMSYNMIGDILYISDDSGEAITAGVKYQNFLVFPAIPCYFSVDNCSIKHITGHVLEYHLEFTEAL